MTGALAGRRIVNTRAAHQSRSLSDLLKSRGAEALEYPCIAIVPPDDTTLLDAALHDLAAGHYAWLVLTSANTVLSLSQRLTSLALTLKKDAFLTAAIGPATAHAAQELLALNVVHLPEEYVAESLAEDLPFEPGARILLPESEIAPLTLAKMLKVRGANVNVVPAYRTVKGKGGDEVPRLLAERHIDALTFTSSSTVTYFLERLSDESGRLTDLQDVCIACIGPKTAATARAHGLSVAVVPSEHTLEGLVNALDHYFAQQVIASGDQL